MSGGDTYDVPMGPFADVQNGSWSPDGRYVAYWSSHGAKVVDLARGCERTIEEAAIGRRVYNFTWRADGARLAYIDDNPRDHLVVVSPDGTGRREIADVDGGAEWAPDGSNRIAFGDREGIKVADLDTRQIRLVHPTTDGAESPRWSPDATRIAFTTRADPGLWLVGERGPEGAKLLDKPVVLMSWSPDGSQVAYAYQSKIWLVAADGSSDRVLEASGYTESAPLWTSDGHHLVFVANAFDSRSGGRLILVSIDDAEARTIGNGITSISGTFTRR